MTAEYKNKMKITAIAFYALLCLVFIFAPFSAAHAQTVVVLPPDGGVVTDPFGTPPITNLPPEVNLPPPVTLPETPVGDPVTIPVGNPEPPVAPAGPVGAPVVFAQDGAGGGGDIESSCATDVWTAMVNQAVLQTRREVVMNQTYITKGDSVLAYGCFAELMLQAGNLGVFSESQRWVNKQVDIIGDTVTVNVDMGQDSLDGAITDTTMNAYEAYMDSFFNHDFLGGFGTAPVGPQMYAPCGRMAEVWQAAKCLNAEDLPLFLSFEQLIDNGPRIFPAGFTCENTGITQEMIDVAKHEDVEKSDVVTQFDILAPEDGGCYPAVATGVTIERNVGAGRITTKTTYQDGLCLTPGCSFLNGGGGGAGECQVAQ